MRNRLFLPATLSAALLIACQPAPNHTLAARIPGPTPQTKMQAPEIKVPTSAPTPTVAPTATAPQSATRGPEISRKSLGGLDFDGVSFDSRSHHLLVIDQPEGPGSRYSTSEELARETGAILAINAGFFTPEGKPLGIVASKGKAAGSWNSASSLGTGIYLERTSGKTEIVRRSSRSAVKGSREMLQAGPLLVERGKAVSGLDSQKPALRSIILTDGGTRWWIGKTSSCSLAQLAGVLSKDSPAPWEVTTALNLDGGRSTDLHISADLPGGPLNARTFFNRPVRNFLILVPR